MPQPPYLTPFYPHPPIAAGPPNPNRSTAPVNSPPQTSDLLRAILGPDWDHLITPGAVLQPNVPADVKHSLMDNGDTPGDIIRRIFGSKGDIELFPSQRPPSRLGM